MLAAACPGQAGRFWELRHNRRNVWRIKRMVVTKGSTTAWTICGIHLYFKKSYCVGNIHYLHACSLCLFPQNLSTICEGDRTKTFRAFDVHVESVASLNRREHAHTWTQKFDWTNRATRIASSNRVHELTRQTKLSALASNLYWLQWNLKNLRSSWGDNWPSNVYLSQSLNIKRQRVQKNSQKL